MTPHPNDLPWLQRKSPLLFQLLAFVFGWLALDSTWRLHHLGQPVVPHIFEALFIGLAITLGTRFVRWKNEESSYRSRHNDRP